IIKKSSNVGVSKIALNMPAETLWEKLSDMGFGELTKSHFPGEVAGYLPFFGEWRPIKQATLSYGYGISVTPLQLAQAYSIFANDGILNPISLEAKSTIVRGQRVLSSEVAHSVLAMMETVVSHEGTAWDAHIPGYRVAGKTGTVKKAVNGSYSDDQYRALFAGIAPASNPRFVCVVVVNEPRNKYYYGGKVAAPVFASVVSEALRLLNVAPDDLPSENLQMASNAGGAL
ncbi:MAG: penicillin-binding transpeptidase domain-containing protein, partial [Gammaproteobacteria bacterium]|nr:penicillin-binding transpeptidase domain-containing protein [Gammaproteobacteria bacterium]